MRRLADALIQQVDLASEGHDSSLTSVRRASANATIRPGAHDPTSPADKTRVLERDRLARATGR